MNGKLISRCPDDKIQKAEFPFKTGMFSTEISFKQSKSRLQHFRGY